MDILVSSNLERLVYLATGRNGDRVKSLMQDLNEKGVYSLNEEERSFMEEFIGFYADENQTLKSIKTAFDENNYLIDPHTAVAFYCYKNLKMDSKTLIVSTASPYKFPSTIAIALGLDDNKSEFEIIKDIALHTGTSIPKGIAKLQESEKTTSLKTTKEIEDIVYYK